MPYPTIEPTLFEKSSPGRQGYSLPASGVDSAQSMSQLPAHLRRARKPQLPELSELDVVRHFTRLSQLNLGIDTTFYPLGSCTMKYNPRINEEIARLPGFSQAHPYQKTDHLQGALRVMHELSRYLCEISGMDACTLQPAAGAHGELAGVLMIRAYHESRGNARKVVLIPDSAHGTNPATAAMAGYEVRTLKTGKDGILTPDIVREALSSDVAALMVTNPSTLGLFESHIQEITTMLHDAGALVYCDGANMNAVLGITRVGDMGIDCLHFNLHKTFTTPHGGGGPGSGPVVVKKILEPFLPKPVVVHKNGVLDLDFDRPQSIGRMRAFFGNYGMFIRAYTYIREMGPEGIKAIAQYAVLNANYLRAKLESALPVAVLRRSLHEVVFSDKFLKDTGLKTIDIAKRLIDFGYHPPTVYFPLVVTGALMMEPTETESKQTLDGFITAMQQIAREVRENPDVIRQAPHHAYRRRLDEVRAIKDPVLKADCGCWS